jgi:hypothetical protein
MDYGIAETGIARGSPPGTTTEVLRFGFPFAEFRVVSVRLCLYDVLICAASCASIKYETDPILVFV